MRPERRYRGGRPAGSFKLSPEQIKRLLRAYDYGVSTEDLCERFQIHEGTLNYYLRKLNHPNRQYPNNFRKKPNADKPAAYVHRDGAHGEQEGDVLST